MSWLSLETELVLSFNDRRSDSESEKRFLPTWQYLCLPGKPDSSSSIVQTCILPILLYGVENWVLTSESIKKLECFQGEIVKRILQMSKQFSNKWLVQHSVGTLFTQHVPSPVFKYSQAMYR